MTLSYVSKLSFFELTPIDSTMKIGISKLHVSLGCCPFYGNGSVVNSLIIAALIVCNRAL